jgi:hypothetical protein
MSHIWEACDCFINTLVKGFEMKGKIKNIILSVFVLFFAASAMAEAVKVEKVDVLDKRVSLNMPTSFSEMSKAEVKAKYPANSRPTEVYTNAETTVNFAFNYTVNKIAENQLDAFAQQMKQMLAQFSPKISKVKVNGQQAVLFDFVTPAADTEIHNLMLAMSVDGRLLLTTFNTTKEEASQWLEVGRESLLSVQVNK